MPVKELIDRFYAQAKRLMEHYEESAKLAKATAEVSRRGGRPEMEVEAMRQASLEIAASTMALAEFQKAVNPLADRLRHLEKKVREEILPAYEEAGETWDAQRAATLKALEQVNRLQEAAKPLTSRAYTCPRTLPTTLLKSRHPRAGALMGEAERAVQLLSDAVVRADLRVAINNLSFSVHNQLSQLTGQRR
ncbi:MAG TPA: hypothetical protein VHQ47_16830 [Phycisphaerae bacterium]|nr:hypothetical protein [Phycisphaerae bacterium]